MMNQTGRLCKLSQIYLALDNLLARQIAVQFDIVVAFDGAVVLEAYSPLLALLWHSRREGVRPSFGAIIKRAGALPMIEAYANV